MPQTRPAPADSQPAVAGGAVKAILIAEAEHLNAGALESLLDQIGDRPARATIVAVASRPRLIHLWAPVTGLITLGQIQEMAVAAAARAARQSAPLLPHGICVQHQVARSWADALRLVDEHDVVVISGRPRCRRDRRRLSAAPMPVARTFEGGGHDRSGGPSR